MTDDMMPDASDDTRCVALGNVFGVGSGWMRLLVGVILAGLVAPLAYSAPSAKDGYFKTPSGNIVCYHSPGPRDRPVAQIGCGIRSGLKPPVRRRQCRDGDFVHDRVFMFATGRVQVPSCAGDPGALVGLRFARVLAYGKTWSGGGLSCRSAVTGLTCRNKSGHGFFLSRDRWRRF
jgi:hypothetical protein